MGGIPPNSEVEIFQKMTFELKMQLILWSEYHLCFQRLTLDIHRGIDVPNGQFFTVLGGSQKFLGGTYFFWNFWTKSRWNEQRIYWFIKYYFWCIEWVLIENECVKWLWGVSPPPSTHTDRPPMATIETFAILDFLHKTHGQVQWYDDIFEVLNIIN